MTTPEQPRSTFPDQAEMTHRWTALAEQSQQLI
jgi:hypothetical protein